MIIMPRDEVLKTSEQEIKYIAIGDHVYAISLISLLLHKENYDVKYAPLIITQEHLESMTPPQREIGHIDSSFLRQTPIVMFESVMYDKRYMRIDGRHRIWAAHKLGLKEVPAIWCSREVWGCFIVGDKFYKDRPLDRLDDDTLPRWEYLPHQWDASPARHGLRRLEDDVHFEPNFEIPLLHSRLDPERFSPRPAVGCSQDTFDKIGVESHKSMSLIMDQLLGKTNALDPFGR